MKPRHFLMAASLAVVAWLAVFGDRTPSGGMAEPVIRTASTSVRRAAPAQKKPAPDPQIDSLQPRAVLIGGAGIEKGYDGVFLSQSWTPPPLPPPKPVPAPPPPPPAAPPLPFTYLGKKFEDGSWEVYLARGDQTLIVREHTAIDSLYRVEAIKAPALSIIYLPLDSVQTLHIGDAD